MKWQEPKKKSQELLYLPVLQKQPEIDFDNIKTADSNTSVNVDHEFINIWQNGPKDDSDKELAKCLSIVGKAFCDLIRAGQGKTAVSTKSSPTDLVTEVDMGIEMLFRMWLKKFCPTHKVIGEESVKDFINPQDTAWYIDPVDGTTNFVNGSQNVSLHMGCLCNGKPKASFVGLPFLGQYYYGHDKVLNKKNEPAFILDNITKKISEPLVIGTEFIVSKLDHKTNFDLITKKLDAKKYQVKSIGFNMMQILNGQINVFYKESAKFWDVVAPAALIYMAAKDFFDIEIYYTKNGATKTKDNTICESLFSNSTNFIEHLNNRHKTNCRIGHILITPKSRLEIKKAILDIIIKGQ